MSKVDKDVHKKRRKVNKNGYKSEMNRGCCDVRMRGLKSREVNCIVTRIVAYLGWVFRGGFGVVLLQL